jgi:surface antigen
MRTALALALCALLWRPAGPLHAVNTFFMDNMPIARMSSEDIDILLRAVNETLDQAPDGTTRRWDNPDTGAGGLLTPRNSYKDKDRDCRDLEVENHAGGMTNRSVIPACRQPDGTWKARP